MKDSKTQGQEVKRTQSRIKTHKPYAETYHTQTAEKDKKEILRVGRGEKDPPHTEKQ